MATSKTQGKRSLEEGEGEDDDDEEDAGGSGSLTCKEDERKKRAIRSNKHYCQADLCTADMTDAKKYHKRHKVCEFHAKEPVVLVSGISQRFCQQCSRFQELSEFDNIKKSCRKRLTEHNIRRRKNCTENQGEASN